jgi:hypothetical protein
MDIVNSNHLRISVRFFRHGYGERFTDFHGGSYKSRDHDRPRPERNYYVKALGIVGELKYRPDGKRRCHG